MEAEGLLKQVRALPLGNAYIPLVNQSESVFFTFPVKFRAVIACCRLRLLWCIPLEKSILLR